MAEHRKVQVVLRSRPLLHNELKEHCQKAFKFDKTENCVSCPTNGNKFYYNYVFDETTSQNEMYQTVAQPLVAQSLQGYNCTILAYGQTGSGKTYTMGLEDADKEEASVGIIPKLVNDIFEAGTENDNYLMEVSCSYLELYNDSISDLLGFGDLNSKNGENVDHASNQESRPELHIRQNKEGEIYVQSLLKHVCPTKEDTLRFLSRGNEHRSTGATEMNQTSSRSHAIFTLYIRRWMQGEEAAATSAKVNLVDLAGSERLARTKAEGKRMKEGIKINGGLLVLGNVISKLSENSVSHVPYRDSKLTRLLQDSLGGNSYTTMIACISPADYNLDESISTLRYAERAKKISNVVKVNIDETQALIIELKNRVKELEMQLGVGGNRPDTPMRQLNDEERKNWKEKLVNVEVELANARNNEENSKNRSQRFLSYLAECRRRAQLFESRFGKFLTGLLDQDGGSIDFSTEESYQEEQREMLIQLQQLQKLLFSLNCADPVKHVTPDVTNLFESILEQSRLSKVSPAKQLNYIMPTIEESETNNASTDFYTGSETSKDPRKSSDFEGLPLSPCKNHQSQQPDPKRLKIDTNEIAVNTSLDFEAVDLLKVKNRDLERQLQTVKESDARKRISQEQQRLKLRTVELNLKQLQQREHKMKQLLTKSERHTKFHAKQAEEAARLKLVRVNLLRDMKQEDKKWRLQMREKEKTITQLKSREGKCTAAISKITRDLDKQKMVSQRKTEEAANAIRRLHKIQKMDTKRAMPIVSKTRRQRIMHNPCNAEDFQKYLNQLQELAGVDKIIHQLIDVRKTNAEQLEEIRDQTFSKEDEVYVKSEENRLTTEISKVTSQIMELKSSVGKMDSIELLKTKLFGMAVTSEEKDKLIRWLIEEQEKHVDPIELKIENNVMRITCDQLEASLAELEENVQVIGNGYWNVNSPMPTLSENSKFKKPFNYEPRHFELESETNSMETWKQGVNSTSSPNKNVLKSKSDAESFDSAKTVTIGKSEPINTDKIMEETSAERDERIKTETQELARNDPAAALRRVKERMNNKMAKIENEHKQSSKSNKIDFKSTNNLQNQYRSSQSSPSNNFTSNKENIYEKFTPESPKRVFAQDIDMKRIQEEILNSPARRALLASNEKQERKRMESQEKYREMKENPKAHLAKLRKRMEDKHGIKK